MADYIVYDSCWAYLESITNLQDRISAIDTLIDKNITLIGTAMDGLNGTVNMYELDDGQVRIKTIYRSVDDIIKANTALETMKTLYVNRLNGRRVVLRDKGTFRFNWPWI